MQLPVPTGQSSKGVGVGPNQLVSFGPSETVGDSADLATVTDSAMTFVDHLKTPIIRVVVSEPTLLVVKGLVV